MLRPDEVVPRDVGMPKFTEDPGGKRIQLVSDLDAAVARLAEEDRQVERVRTRGVETNDTQTDDRIITDHPAESRKVIQRCGATGRGVPGQRIAAIRDDLRSRAGAGSNEPWARTCNVAGTEVPLVVRGRDAGS